MQKKLTITLDEQVYNGLHTVIGRRRISRFIETVVRPHVLAPNLDAAYREMAQDEQREAQALEWAERTLGGVFAYDASEEAGWEDEAPYAEKATDIEKAVHAEKAAGA